MGKVAILYASSTGATEFVATKIKSAIGEASVYNVKNIQMGDLSAYDFYILGTPTVSPTNMQDDWSMFLPILLQEDLKNKKVALFGLGDGEAYPETFVDGMAMLYRWLNDKTQIVGSVPTTGYFFEHSDAVIGGKFVGLPVNEDNEYNYTDNRINPWVKSLKKYF